MKPIEVIYHDECVYCITKEETVFLSHGYKEISRKWFCIKMPTIILGASEPCTYNEAMYCKLIAKEELQKMIDKKKDEIDNGEDDWIT